MRKTVGTWMILFGGVLLLLFLIQTFVSYQDPNSAYTVRGAYDPALNRLNSVDLMARHADSIYQKMGHTVTDTSALLEVVDQVMSKRFYHGTSRYDPSENILAWALGAVIWDDFRMIVIPDHLLRHRVTLCNQHQIVFQHVIAELGIKNYRATGIGTHMVSEVFYDNRWHMYDSDYEPELDGRLSAEDLLSDRDHFQKLYHATPGRYFNRRFDGIINAADTQPLPKGKPLASRLQFFHRTLAFTISYGWIMLMTLGIILKRM